MAALRVMNNSLLLLLLLLMMIIPLLFSNNSSGGILFVESFKVDNMLPKYPLHKDGRAMKMRKLMSVEHAVLDYDDAGANTKHDPRKKPGPGGKP